MGELGEASAAAHREVGQLAVDQGFDHIVSVGEAAQAFTEHLEPAAQQTVHHFPDHAAAAQFITQTAISGDLVLLKGSRASAMDTILQTFLARPA
jgi:UDP-N-acetylmuramoyl-tripeptide--D-alanyl-D-alanine ligase